MNEVMQIETVCNNANVATGASTTIIDNNGSNSTQTITTNNINTGAAPPMVLTVNQQQATPGGGGGGVLKLVSPVEGGAPQLIKVVPANTVNLNSQTEQKINLNSTSTFTISDSSAAAASAQNAHVTVVQKMNDGQNQSLVDGATTTTATTNQRVFSIVTPNQQKNQQQTTVVNVAKTVFNNGQQRVHTLATLPTNTRVIPAQANAANPPKVQILSNVVVSKQNIVINKSSLQAQRQIISNITTQKTITSVPNNKSVVVTAAAANTAAEKLQVQVPQKLQTVNVNVNNIVTTKPLLNNTININQHQQKTLKSVNSMNRQSIQQTPTQQQQQQQHHQQQNQVIQTQKTVKTLSPGSPQPGYVQQQKSAGLKTLSPNMNANMNMNMNMNHYNKIQTPVKMMGQPPVITTGPPRVGGIKTLNAKNLSIVSRGNNLPPKPNYIGKHATQAQKMKNTPTGLHVKNRAMPPQRPSPLSPKYNQKSVINSHQSVSSQIVQNMGQQQQQHGKNYSLQHSPDQLSEDIGEEVRPDFSPSLSYLYQVVMLDHNYGAPPPPLSPPPINRTVNTQHTSPVSTGGALNGALLAAAGREREREKEREEKLAAAAYYTTKQRHAHGHGHGHAHPHGRLSGALPQIPQNAMPPYTSPTSLPVSENRNLLSNQDDDAGSVISSDGGPNEDGDEGEETETAPEGEGDEDGVTRCICDFDHDDGYMISCDVCLSWQHVDCMGLDRNAIPEKYQCVRCQPRHVDRKHARSIQIRKREDFMNMGTLPRETVPSVGGPVGSGSGNASDSSSDTSTAESTGEPPNSHYGRHSTGKVSLNNNFVGKKRGTPVSLSTRRKSEPAASHNRRGPLAHKRQQRRESARESSVTATGGRRTAMKKREKKVKQIKRKMKSRSSVDDDSQDSWHGVANAYSNTMGASLMQLRQWIENYEEAVTNHYSPELRARISNIRANGSHNTNLPDKQAPATAQADVTVQKCKVSGQQLTGMKIVQASQALSPNSPVIELRGKYMLSTQHRTSTGGGGAGGAGGLQTRQHSQRPGPFLFFYRLPRDGTEVCVDTRTYGNDARFIRRSCRPNAELRHLVEKGTLHLYVITISNVEKNSELTIKHESHDLAAVAAASSSANNPTQAIAAIAAAGIQCACGGSPQTCGLYNNNRKNGGNITDTLNTNTNQTTTNNITNTNSNSTETKTTNSTENNTTHRKRRGRRASTPNRTETSPVPPPEVESPPATITSQPEPEPSPQPIVTEPVVAAAVVPPTAPPPPPPPPALSTRRASSHQRAAAAQAPPQPAPATKTEHPPERERERERDRDREPRDKDREDHKKETQEIKDKKKKMTREERKMEAIMKAIERMEKADQRKQELQARQAQRKDTDPSEQVQTPQKQVNKQENGDTEREAVRTRRKKRKGRARTISTNSQSSTRRRTRVNSTDSYVTSGDESLLSPPLPSSTSQESQPEPRHTRSMTSQDENAEPVPRECVTPEPPAIQNKVSTPNSQASDISSPGQVNAAAGLLLALANGGTQNDLQKSPEADGNSSGSNSSLQSSPSTPLSSACLLVAAAVGPLEPGFKFPKTKKAIMNEWLNKSPDPIQSSMSPMEIPNDAIQQPVIEYYNTTTNNTSNKGLATLVQAANLCDSPPQGSGGGGGRSSGGAGNAKKRWLRQAISEECDSPCSRPESPPGSSEMVAPPKKRRLARESLSSEQSFTPPTTPTMLVPPSNSLADEDYPNNDEEFYTNEDRNATLSDGSPTGIEEQSGKEPSQPNLTYNSTIIAPSSVEYQTTHDEVELKDQDDEIAKSSSFLDPRLGRDPRPMFRDSAQLLGNIEKTIRFYEENLTGPVTVAPQTQPELPPPQPVLSPIIPSTIPIQIPIMETETIINMNMNLNMTQQHVEIMEEEVTIPLQQPAPSETPPIVTPDSPESTPQVQIESTPPPPIPPVVPVAPVETDTPIVEPVVPPSKPSRVTIIETPKKEKPPVVVVKPEVITPTKRKVKLSISEYRQRKQLKVPDNRSGNTTPERANSPETPPPPPPPPPATLSSTSTTTASTTVTNNPIVNPVKVRARSRSLSTSSTSSLSSDEEIVNSSITPESVEQKTTGAEPQVLVAFNSAPTAVERQRENVERLKKAFGLTLDDETRRSVLNNVTAAAVTVTATTTTTSSSLVRDESVATPPLNQSKISISIKSPPHLPPVNNTLTTSDLLAKIEPSSTTKLMLGLDSPKYSSEKKFASSTSISIVTGKRARSPSPAHNRDLKKDKLLSDCSQLELDKDIDEAYSKFDESVSNVYIPSFNNPVYPNSTQYGFSSVIDTSPYEGRNPSPPPSELLKSTCYK